MKMYFKVVSLLLGLFVVQNLAAQQSTDMEINSDLVNHYNYELFHWDYNWFTGLRLNFQNQSSSLLNLNKNMANALKLYPDSNEYYQSYRKISIMGNIFLWGGFAIAMGGAVLMPIFPDGYSNQVIWGVALGGIAIELIGAFIMPTAYEKLFYAVRSYNQHRISEYR